MSTIGAPQITNIMLSYSSYSYSITYHQISLEMILAVVFTSLLRTESKVVGSMKVLHRILGVSEREPAEKRDWGFFIPSPNLKSGYSCSCPCGPACIHEPPSGSSQSPCKPYTKAGRGQLLNTLLWNGVGKSPARKQRPASRGRVMGSRVRE